MIIYNEELTSYDLQLEGEGPSGRRQQLCSQGDVGDCRLEKRGRIGGGCVFQLSFNSEKLMIQNHTCSTGHRSSGFFCFAVLKAFF